MKRRLVLILAASGVVAALAAVVQQAVAPLRWNESAVIVRDGRPLRLDDASGRDPGLYLKMPFIETAVTLDRRTQSVSRILRDVRVGGGGWAQLTTDAFYRITDPIRFYRSGAADGALGKALEEDVRAAAAGTPTGAAGALDVPPAEISRISRRLAARFGLVVQDLTVADSGSSAEQDAVRLKAEAIQATAAVKADAEMLRRTAAAETARDAAAIQGEGERRALEVRGDGDAERATILADAYGQDPGFARFLRRLEAYDQALDSSNTTLILSPDNAFLSLFGHGPAAETVR